MSGRGSQPGPGTSGDRHCLDVADAPAALAAYATPGRRFVVLVDGGSGSGKTTLGRALVAALAARGRRAHLVSLDAFYPGWSGLAAGSAMVVDDVLGRGGFRRWDWEQDRPGEWVTLDPAADLVVEGCGALTPRSAAYADLRVWLELDAASRKHRALARDGDAFAPWWDHWAAQEAAHWVADRPASLADVVVRATPC